MFLFVDQTSREESIFKTAEPKHHLVIKFSCYLKPTTSPVENLHNLHFHFKISKLVKAKLYTQEKTTKKTLGESLKTLIIKE